MPSTSTGSCRRHRSIGGAVRGGEKPDPRRRQQPGSSPWRGRGDPALYRPGRGSLGLGRRREPIPRSHRFLGTADLGSSPGGRHRGTASPAGARLDLWRPDRGRGATGFACFRPHAGDRDAPPCQFRNRGRHVRGPARAGFHRQAQAHQVRRRLPRACRRPACGSRLGRGHAGHPGDPGYHAGRRAGHRGGPIQQPQRRRIGNGALAQAGCRRHRRTGRGEHGRRASAGRLPRRAARDDSRQ